MEDYIVNLFFLLLGISIGGSSYLGPKYLSRVIPGVKNTHSVPQEKVLDDETKIGSVEEGERLILKR